MIGTGIRINILGSGTCVPSLSRSSCSILVEALGKKILFDCGPGTMRRLLEAGHSIFDVDIILLSHFHADHCGEFVNFLFSTKYPYDDQRKGRPLMVGGGLGFLGFYEGLRNVYGDWMESPTALFEKKEISAGSSIYFEGVNILTSAVAHKPESLAYRIEVGGFSAVYSGDTDYSEALIDFVKGCDVFVCESAMPDAMKVPGHLTPSLAGEIAEKAGAKHLVLTHFYPECAEVDIEKECRRSYSGMLTLAEDLMTLDF